MCNKIMIFHPNSVMENLELVVDNVQIDENLFRIIFQQNFGQQVVGRVYKW